ncbi:MAG: class I SAM-dependent methyltransferase [Candidatus Izemoplasmatales bacterium]|nr:class I SAM-dependent methyltransferase [Candidatus Izemoplasmatales bacterium]
MIDINELAHRIISEKINVNVSVDMTSGNGHDTLFLARLSDHTYAFDIQTVAIESTRTLLENNNQTNVTLINDSHEKILNYVKEKIDAAIYNLGYLPGSDKTVMTNSISTVNSLDHLISILAEEGIIVIVLYPHNPEEIAAVVEYTSKLSPSYDCMEHKILNKESAPFLITIKSNKKC